MMQWLMSKMKKGPNFTSIESEEEWEMVQEMFNTLADEQEAE